MAAPSAYELRRLSRVESIFSVAGSSVRNVNTYLLEDGAVVWCSETGCDWRFIKGSAAAPDNITVVQPSAGPGRFVREYLNTQPGVIPNPVVGDFSVSGNINLWTGQSGGWDDVIGQIVIPTTGVGRPTWAFWAGSAVFEGWKFAVNDAAQFELHFKHGTIDGTPVYLHSHWLSDGTNVQPVVWQFTYTYARGYGQDHFSATGTVVSATGTPNGAARGHYITEIVAPITIATIEPDGMMIVQLKRITNGGVNNTDGIFVEKCDAHHQNNAVYTKNKNVPFRT